MNYLELLTSLLLAGMPLLGFFWAACPCCRAVCTFCSDGTRGTTVQVVISGMADTACADCELLDGTYIVPIAEAVGFCGWRYDFPATICAFYDELFIDLGGTNINVVLRQGVGNRHSWRSNAAGFNDCNNWSSFNLPAFGNVTTNCTNAGSTCTLTSI